MERYINNNNKKYKLYSLNFAKKLYHNRFPKIKSQNFENKSKNYKEKTIEKNEKLIKFYNFNDFDQIIYKIREKLNEMEINLANNTIDLKKEKINILNFENVERKLFIFLYKSEINNFLKAQKIKKLNNLTSRRKYIERSIDYQIKEKQNSSSLSQVFPKIKNTLNIYKNYSSILKSKITNKKKVFLSLDFLEGLDFDFPLYSVNFYILDSSNGEILIPAKTSTPVRLNDLKNKTLIGELNLLVKPNNPFSCFYFELCGLGKNKNERLVRLGWSVLPVLVINQVQYKKPGFNTIKKNGIKPFYSSFEDYLPDNMQNAYYNDKKFNYINSYDPKIVNQALIGKFKIPFYHYPIKLSCPQDELKYENRIDDLFLFVQTKEIEATNFEAQLEYENMIHKNINGFSQITYIVPEIHKIIDKKEEKEKLEILREEKDAFEKETIRLNEIVEIQKKKLENLLERDDDKMLKILNGERNLLKAIKINPFDIKNEEEASSEEYLFRKWRNINEGLKGLKITFLKLQKQKENKPVKVRFVIEFNRECLEDDLYQKITNYTSEFRAKSISKIKKSYNIEINESFSIASDIGKLLEIFSVLPKNVYLTIKILSGKDIFGWKNFELGKLEENILKLKKGDFLLDLNQPPKLRVNSKKKVKTFKNYKIKIRIEEFDYSRNNLKKYIKKKPIKMKFSDRSEQSKSKSRSKSKKGNLKSKSPKEKIKNKSKSKSPKKKKKKKVNTSPYIPCDKQYANKYEYNGEAVDIYLDQIKYMPDNATAVKLFIKIVDQNIENILVDYEILADLQSTCSIPFFEFKMEIKKNTLNKVAYVMIIILTFDRYNVNKEVKILGYAYFPILLSKETNFPSINNSDTVYLNEGHYQIPVYSFEYIQHEKTNIIDMDKLDAHERIPALTILLRCNKSPIEGDKVLTLDNVNQEKWLEKGVFKPFLGYYEGKYNNNLIGTLNEQETELYFLRKAGISQTILLTSRFIFLAYNLENEIKEVNEVEQENDQNAKMKNLLGLLFNDICEMTINFSYDYKFFAKYSESIGFSISIDGLFNLPDKGIYIIIFCINPPGGFYKEEIRTDITFVVSNINWNSSIKVIKYEEDYIPFYQIPYYENSHFIFSIKKIEFKKKKPIIKDYGFSILPIFTSENYVYSGCFQLPIFEGDLNENSATRIQNTDPFEMLLKIASKKNKKLGKKMLTPIKYGSIIVRLKDNWLGSKYTIPYDTNRINTEFIPNNLLKKYDLSERSLAKYEKSKKMSSLMLSDVNKTEMNIILKQIIKEAYDLT